MSRRSTPKQKIDDNAFPVRVMFYVPGTGFGVLIDEIRSWLNREVGPENFAWHSAGRGVGGYRTAIYFRTPSVAARLVDAFPALELADETTQPGYRSPSMPFGRSAE